MKKQKMITGALLLSLLMGVENANAQSLKDILNSKKVQSAITSVTGGKGLSAENLSGTWNYVTPAVQLEGDDALKNVAGSVMSTELEKKLSEQCAKVGIVEGAFSYTFNTDGTFTSVIKGKTLNGTYAILPEEKIVELNYGKTDKFNFTKLRASTVISASELSLLFEADKLLDLLTKLSEVSENTTLKSVSQLAGQYNGMLMGFKMKK